MGGFPGRGGGLLGLGRGLGSGGLLGLLLFPRELACRGGGFLLLEGPLSGFLLRAGEPLGELLLADQGRLG